MLVDADEWVTPSLAEEVRGVVTGTRRPDWGGGRDGSAYWINRRFVFRGRWVRHGGYDPAWNLRLMRRDAARFERLTSASEGGGGGGDMEVHEHIRLPPEAGAAGFLEHDLLHHEIADFTEWVAKQQVLQLVGGGGGPKRHRGVRRHHPPPVGDAPAAAALDQACVGACPVSAERGCWPRPPGRTHAPNLPASLIMKRPLRKNVKRR